MKFSPNKKFEVPWPVSMDQACGPTSRGNPQESSPPKTWGCSNHNMSIDSADSEDVIAPVTLARKTAYQDSPPASGSKEVSSGVGSGSTNPNQGSSSSSSPLQSSAAQQEERPPCSSNKQNYYTLWEEGPKGFWSIPAHLHLARWSDMVQDVCSSSPCAPRSSCNLDDEPPILGINPLQGPAAPEQAENKQAPPNNNESSTTSPAARRRQRHEEKKMQVERVLSKHRTHEEIEVDPSHHIQIRLPPQDCVVDTKKSKKKKSSSSRNKNTPRQPPLETFEVKSDEAAALERSISELTMRSSYAAAQADKNNNNNNSTPDHTVLKAVPDKSRRMAYYAVGKHHRQAGRGGNRRCFFTGKLILGGAPFYAGSVQQGLRTLVVFCLPSALGLPDKEALLKHSLRASNTGTNGTNSTNGGRKGSNTSRLTILSVQPAVRAESKGSMKSLGARSAPALHMDTSRGVLLRATGRSGAASVASKSVSKASRLSSLDDLSLSIEGDLDPNWGLDRDVLLAVLPPANPDILKQMADLYSEQFETLPVQVRQPSAWKLYVKFCFFSGLPIAEGELHYKVMDDIAEQVYGEEIALSHDVFVASIGQSSADILTLPNRTVLQYLRKHYAQQCSKLDDRIFERVSWERVAPEV